jgi:hypothetical protein
VSKIMTPLSHKFLLLIDHFQPLVLADRCGSPKHEVIMLPPEVDKVDPMNGPVVVTLNHHVCHITVPPLLKRRSTDKCLGFALLRLSVLVWRSSDQEQFQWNRLGSDHLDRHHKVRQENLHV